MPQENVVKVFKEDVIRIFISVMRNCPKEQIRINIKEVVENHSFWGERCYIVDVEQSGEITERTIPQWILELTSSVLACGEIQ